MKAIFLTKTETKLTNTQSKAKDNVKKTEKLV